MSCSQKFWVGFCLNEFKSSCISSHLHFNNDSCILDVCLPLKLCVLVGLDWAEPIMFFLLHVTFHAFFMHTYLHFSIFLYGSLFGTLLFVSLSFSLSFYALAFSMAPKRKSTPSWNPLRSGASSSSPPANSTPSHVRFHDDKSQKDFSKNFSRRDIHSEH